MMCRSVLPVKVSPFIKTVRWACLILGVFYGANRHKMLKAYEERVRPKRKQELDEKYAKEKEEIERKNLDFTKSLAQHLEITDFSRVG